MGWHLPIILWICIRLKGDKVIQKGFWNEWNVEQANKAKILNKLKGAVSNFSQTIIHMIYFAISASNDLVSLFWHHFQKCLVLEINLTSDRWPWKSSSSSSSNIHSFKKKTNLRSNLRFNTLKSQDPLARYLSWITPYILILVPL